MISWWTAHVLGSIRFLEIHNWLADESAPNKANQAETIGQYINLMTSLNAIPSPKKSRAPKYIQLGDLPASQSDPLPVSQGVELHLLCGPATPDIPQKGQLVNSKPRGTEIKPNERVKCRWFAGSGNNVPNWEVSTSAAIYEVSYAIYRSVRSDPTWFRLVWFGLVRFDLIWFPLSNFRRGASMPGGDVWALKSNATKSNNLLTLPLKSTVKQSAIDGAFRPIAPQTLTDIDF